MIKQEQWENVLKAIASGLNNDDACDSAGISRSIFYKKIKEDLDFLDTYKKAKIQFKLTHIQKISRANNWQSSAWLLERKFAEEFGKKLDITTMGNKLTELKINVIRPKHKETTKSDTSVREERTDKNKNSS
tara:strand:- start:451 stop:846 length:396 start_codon:yes stop_codon:yes gene_type:complete